MDPQDDTALGGAVARYAGQGVVVCGVPSNTTELRGTLDVSGLPSGLYYLHLRDGVKWLAGGKIIVE